MTKAVTSEKIKLENVRIAFAHVHSPTAFQEGQDKQFQLTALLDPSIAAHAGLIAQVKESALSVYKEAWQGKKVKLIGQCFGDADEESVEYDGFEGMFYVRVKSKTRPVIVDRDRTPLVEEDGKPYSGCYAHVSCTLWTQDNQFGKRINGNLRGVQFVRDGDAFSGAPNISAEDEFEVVDGDKKLDLNDEDKDENLESVFG